MRFAGIILGMGSANVGMCYYVSRCVIGWAHSHWLSPYSEWSLCLCMSSIFDNTFKPKENDRYFADDIDVSRYILIWISLKIITKDPTNNNPALIQKMVWHQTGDKPLSQTNVDLAYGCKYASIRLSEIDFMNRGHDDVIKWRHFPRYWPFVRGIHRYPVNSPHKGQWRGVLMFSLICARINGWVNNRKAGDLRRYRVHYDVIVMQC